MQQKFALLSLHNILSEQGMQRLRRSRGAYNECRLAAGMWCQWMSCGRQRSCRSFSSCCHAFSMALGRGSVIFHRFVSHDSPSQPTLQWSSVSARSHSSFKWQELNPHLPVRMSVYPVAVPMHHCSAPDKEQLLVKLASCHHCDEASPACSATCRVSSRHRSRCCASMPGG